MVRKLLLLLVLLLVGAAVAAWALLPRPRRLNVLLVSIDTLRPDHLHCYGYPRRTSPTLDRLAADGVLFENAVSTTSWTLPAHAALFTGLPDSVHGLKDVDCWLDGGRTTLAERFKDAGYRTAGFFSGPFLHAGYGFSQGFDSYTDCTSTAREVLQAKTVGEALEIMHGPAPQDVSNDRVRTRVEKWLRQNHRDSFFLFVHLFDVHYDWIPPPPYDTRFGEPYDGKIDGRDIRHLEYPPGGLPPRDRQRLLDLYDGEIAWTDHTVGRILQLLRELGRDEDTLVVVTSDHGEEFFEHGGFTHRHTLFDEVVRIPLIIRRPDRAHAGTRVKHQVSLYDVAPTILELADLPPFAPSFGTSLAASMRDPGGAPPTPIAVCELNAANRQTHLFSLRALGWKMIIDWDNRNHRVFDLAADPGEQHVLEESAMPRPAAELKRLYAEFSKRMEEVSRQIPRPGERDTPTIPAMNKKQLESLGYLK